MGILSEVRKGVVAVRPLRALVYGLPGIGKSTFAAGAPGAIFLDAEHGTLGLDVARVEINRWRDLQDALKELAGEHPYKTVILDTVDAVERMLVDEVCRQADAQTIDNVGGGFGRGWTRVESRWNSVLEQLANLQHARGLNVILLAHCNASTFSDPAGEDYTRWQLRLNKKLKESTTGWVDEMLFATYDVEKDKKTRKGKGGHRVLRTEWRPGFDAKNRRDLPFEIALDWDSFKQALVSAMPKGKAVPDPQPQFAEEAANEDGDFDFPVGE